MSHHTIETLTPNDEDAFIFCSRFIAQHWDQPLKQAQNFIRRLAKSQAGSFCLVAKEDARCVGMIVVYPEDKSLHPTYGPWISALYVEPSAQSRYVAFRLMRNVLHLLRAQNFRRVYFDSSQRHLQEWYLRLGYTSVGKADWHGRETLIFAVDL